MIKQYCVIKGCKEKAVVPLTIGMHFCRKHWRRLVNEVRKVSKKEIK